MDQREFQQKRSRELVQEMTEEQFLKELYLFMKKRETPIERIPHLGFKQIDLFLMFKTVNDLGGYYQVTSQQLWKQVYNTLGGNPRSTSAATCTRRHYEKLMLPYECHIKGILMSMVPPQQLKPFHFGDYDGPRPAKRKMVPNSLQQSPYKLQVDPHRTFIPLPLPYPHYYQPGSAILSTYVPIPSAALTPQRPPAPKLADTQFPFRPTTVNKEDVVREPLEHLRFLSEQYKTSSGLAEPLNLSVKAPSQDVCNPVSSFTPPAPSKNPKFLNKPSTLYPHHHTEILKNEDGDSSEGVAKSLYPVKSYDDDVVEVPSSSNSPIYDLSSMYDDANATAQKSSSPVRPKEVVREASPETKQFNLGNLLQGVTRESDGKMEIEIPLSLWLKLCKSSTLFQSSKEIPLPAQEEASKQRDWYTTDLSNHSNRSSSVEDIRSVSSQSPVNHRSTIQNCVNSYSNPLPSSSPLKNAVGRFEEQDIRKPCTTSQFTSSWNYYRGQTQASPILVESGSSPVRVQEDVAPKFHTEGRQKAETGPPPVTMGNSGSASLLQLTAEEIIKLKKIISSSS
ncbi:AT-rich interaction domain 6 isoform 2-T2 [Pholidichthys leucotaenia]